MANLSEDIQCASSDTRPPMLDRTDFASWQQLIRLYCRGKENGVNILKSIDEGPFLMGTFRETLAEGTEGALHLGPEHPRVYSDLSPEDKERYNADILATNILLQGLPKDIYTLINHYTDAKDIWDNVMMLLEGSELTKEDQESQLFVTAVKQNRGLRDSNYDQLYAYLKQHEAHANENKMMLDRFTQHTVDLLVLMSNVSHPQYHSLSSTTPPSTYIPPHFADNSQLDSGLSPTDNLIENLTNTLALLTQSYKTYLPQTNNQLKTSSNPRNQATVQDSRYVKDNALPVVQSNVSSVPLDAYMMILNDMYEPHAQSISKTTQNIVVDNSLTAELNTYKEQVELYKKTGPPVLCPKALNTLDNKHASTSLPKKKQVTFEEQCAMSKSNTHIPIEQLKCQKTNVHVPPSTGVNSCTDAGRSQPRSNTKKRTWPRLRRVNMPKVEEQP
ncbi:hypothetical protein Tco_0446048 [Tanacetum coccineum]